MQGDPAELSQLDHEAWAHLAAAVTEPAAPLRCLTLGSVDAKGAPQLRSVILRAVDSTKRELTFHTDIRSKKWAELGQAPGTSVLGYDAGRRIQLRFTGKAALFSSGTPHHDVAWQGLSPWNRNAYCGGPPGHAIAKPNITGPRDAPPSEAETAAGHARLGVIVFSATDLDWYQHGRGSNRRARFDYAQGSQAWITP